MTNEQLAALLRPYHHDLSDLAKSAEHVIPGNEPMLLSVVSARLQILAKMLGESIARLDHPLVAVNCDERPVYRSPDETLKLSEQVNAHLRQSLDSMVAANSRNESILSVGEGSGQLFVHGSYEAVKRVQTMIIELERFQEARASAPR